MSRKKQIRRRSSRSGRFEGIETQRCNHHRSAALAHRPSPSMIDECHRLAVRKEFQSSRSIRRREQLVAATISGPMAVFADAGTSQICSGARRKGARGCMLSFQTPLLSSPVKLLAKMLTTNQDSPFSMLRITPPCFECNLTRVPIASS